MFGERNTNTNYLEKLIELNLDIVQLPGSAPKPLQLLQKGLPGKEWLLDAYFNSALCSTLGWKHTRVADAEEIKQQSAYSSYDISVVSLTKNPYSWLLSLHRRPYHQYAGELEFEEFLQTPWKTVGRDNVNCTTLSPVELWNRKNASYENVVALGGLRLATEDLFKAPEAIITRIAKLTGQELRQSNFVNYEKSTKDKSKSFAYYRDYYLNEIWRKEISQEARDIINDQLDHQLLSEWGYTLL